MFAKHKLGAACLESFGGIQAGAIVPECNELYATVEEWLKSNEWADLPEGFGVPELSEDDILRMRSEAYADKDNGSDRLFIEYQALLAKGSSNADDKKAQWLDRREEIKSQYPVT